jgi:integrase
VFTSERGGPFTTAGFARMVERAGSEAGLGFKAHPHMLRHACGYALANKGHDTRALQAYLGWRRAPPISPASNGRLSPIPKRIAHVWPTFRMDIPPS